MVEQAATASTKEEIRAIAQTFNPEEIIEYWQTKGTHRQIFEVFRAIFILLGEGDTIDSYHKLSRRKHQELAGDLPTFVQRLNDFDPDQTTDEQLAMLEPVTAIPTFNYDYMR